ncbi:YceI family protein [Leptobacterium sp. I13]|uniref:YceI family protein n=1 Tax=Leptobacterium meishanense TaxID=3128904 RepID=UPI0030EC9E5F
MKKLIVALSFGLIAFYGFAQESFSTETGHIKFYSHTSVEDIEANNYKVISKVTPSTGAIVFSVPMQSFEFEKALMQKHFNSGKFLDTKEFPKAKFKGLIRNLPDIDFSSNGTYIANVEGELTIHGVTKNVSEQMTIEVSGNTAKGNAKFDVVLADYDVVFTKGKPSTNIAKTVEVTVALDLAKK